MSFIRRQKDMILHSKDVLAQKPDLFILINNKFRFDLIFFFCGKI